MKLFLTSIKRVTTMQPELFYVTIAANGDSGGTSVDVSVQVELKGSETMGLTLAQIESSAIEKAKVVLARGV
ncbi:MAG: hypothetical protein HY789_07895 [Deltaproteobacteria bacterium]|jgi:hypothetical protein|nr:hypothetical protein [Deltaproteobacteria bacterium]